MLFCYRPGLIYIPLHARSCKSGIDQVSVKTKVSISEAGKKTKTLFQNNLRQKNFRYFTRPFHIYMHFLYTDMHESSWLKYHRKQFPRGTRENKLQNSEKLCKHWKNFIISFIWTVLSRVLTFGIVRNDFFWEDTFQIVAQNFALRCKQTKLVKLVTRTSGGFLLKLNSWSKCVVQHELEHHQLLLSMDLVCLIAIYKRPAIKYFGILQSFNLEHTVALHFGEQGWRVWTGYDAFQDNLPTWYLSFLAFFQSHQFNILLADKEPSSLIF